MSSIGGIRGGYAAIVQQVATRRSQNARGTQVSRTETSGLHRTQQSRPSSQSTVAQGVDRVLGEVSDFSHQADKMVIDLASGQDTNIHNTMLELEKADIALKYTVQLRNRALNAYEELMRIQV